VYLSSGESGYMRVNKCGEEEEKFRENHCKVLRM